MAAVLRRPREPCRFRVAPREASVAVVVTQLVGADACVRMCPDVCVCASMRMSARESNTLSRPHPPPDPHSHITNICTQARGRAWSTRCESKA